jgi:hypothetical protein
MTFYGKVINQHFTYRYGYQKNKNAQSGLAEDKENEKKGVNGAELRRGSAPLDQT